MIVFLIGYMASGKSVVGRQLAHSLGCRFVDTDEWIEARTCKTIPQIFSEDGEDFFREKEKECLEFLLDKDNMVIATGGGMPCFNDSISLMNELGETIYLSAQKQTLVNRLWTEKSNRPKISSCNTQEELTNVVSKHLSERGEFYKQSKYTMAVDDKSVLQITLEIKQEIL